MLKRDNFFVNIVLEKMTEKVTDKQFKKLRNNITYLTRKMNILKYIPKKKKKKKIRTTGPQTGMEFYIFKIFYYFKIYN